MTLRLRTNYAWACRWLAKTIGEHANRIDPIKLRPVAKPTPPSSPHYRASLDVAREAIQRARERAHGHQRT